MGDAPIAPAEMKAAPPHRHYFLLGALLCIAGPAIYFAQFQLKHFDTPWYAPLLGTAGLLLMAVAFWRKRRVWRAGVLGLFLLLVGFQWFLVIGSRLPAYTGPAQAGNKIPSFAAAFADGRAFTEKDLESGTPVVLVFNRGHW